MAAVAALAGTVDGVCDRCDDEPDYWRGRFGDPDEDQDKVIDVAAKVAAVHCARQLELLLTHPRLTPDQLAHVTLRVVQPPGTYTRGHVGFLVLGEHTEAAEHLAGHSTLGRALVTLARTWTGTVKDLATAAVAIAATDS